MPASTCLFCRIARREVQAHLVEEGARVVAFLDLHPIRPGHVLVVPREHFEHFDDLPPEVVTELMKVAQRLAPALRMTFGVQRVGLFFTGVDIAHAHAHVVPMVEATDITSGQYIAEPTVTFRPAPRADREALDQAAASIRRALANGDER